MHMQRRQQWGYLGIEWEIEDVVEDQFGFRREKRTWDAEKNIRTLEPDEKLCACFINWQKAFDHVNWTKLMEAQKKTDQQLHMDHWVKV